MLRFALAVIMLSLGLLLAGCQTMTMDKEQQVRKYSRISDMNRRMLADDIDAVFLLDKPSQLTRWHVRND